MNIINIDQVKNLILGTRKETGKGRAFSVVFIKANGERREMRARLGMVRGVTGKGQSYNPADLNQMTVWELANGYRNIPLERIVSLRVPDGHRHLKTVVRPGDYIAKGAL